MPSGNKPNAPGEPKLLKKMFQDCWAASDNKASFEQALNGYGLYLAKGDKRGFVAMDYKGEVYSLSRWTKIQAKTLKERLGNPELLPEYQGSQHPDCQAHD